MKKKCMRLGARLFFAALGAALAFSAAGKNPAFLAWLSETLCTSTDIEALFSFFK